MAEHRILATKPTSSTPGDMPQLWCACLNEHHMNGSENATKTAVGRENVRDMLDLLLTVIDRRERSAWDVSQEDPTICLLITPGAFAAHQLRAGQIMARGPAVGVEVRP